MRGQTRVERTGFVRLGMPLMTEELGRYSGFWDRLAPIWDYGLSICGMKEKYRKRAVDKLNLNRGDTVLDLACGSGLNFKYLQEKVREKGKIIGLDYSSKMLEEARKKTKSNNWDNIELIEEDAANFDLDEDVDGVLCTWAMVSISNYIGALKNSIDVLKGGGRYVVLDFKENPGYAGKILNPIYRAIFSATHQDITRTPWKEMKRYLEDVEIEVFPFGSILKIVGWFLIVVGGVLVVWAFVAFRSFRRVSGEKIDLLITWGPYRYIRNPQYTSLMLFLSGITLIQNSLYFLPFAVMAVLTCHMFTLFEERELEKIFGEKYVKYNREVPRYLPRLKRKVKV